MARQKDEDHAFSRRTFLKQMRWAPVLCLPAPLYLPSYRPLLAEIPGDRNPTLDFTDFRVTPHYPAKSPLDEVLRKVLPGTDEYVTEQYAQEIMRPLDDWSRALQAAPPSLDVLARFLDAKFQASSLVPIQQAILRSGYGIEVVRRKFANSAVLGREQFLQEIKAYLASMSRVETAEFEITGIEEIGGSSPRVRISIRYDLVGAGTDAMGEQRVGQWLTQWSRDEANGWRVLRWEATEETFSRARSPIFIDVTSQALGQTESYKKQMLHGVDYWRTVLDGACGLDVYGNNGMAVGDFDNDGLDDLYVCQPPGLPNRLYHNRGDGTFEDVTEKAGVGVLDGTASALFVDFENKGFQDLLVVCGSGPLLFINQGTGKYLLKRDAFQFARPPQGTFTHAAVADYDRDGLLDIYFCLYSYYLGLDQYHYPAPYFDARNGPPNFLLHNEGNATFRDRTEVAGLNVDNDRYSFACAWGDYNSDGAPDLYVANDFGRNNLYRNDGDGKFTVVSSEAGVEDVGAGMSASWFDFDNDGNQDVYVSNMWSSAGMRVSGQESFHEKDSETIRALYRQHARGNSLYRNLGNGKFQNISQAAGVEVGRWAWSSDAWDFDHDGYPDLYIANGYISGPLAPELRPSGRDRGDLSSFFWRQVVANSPENPTPSPKYELGWNAINELIRSDASWNGDERNVFYANNRDGTFSDVSGAVGLDFPDDSRSFVLTDIDHDGRLEIVLKNRNAPQLRILRNAMKDIGNSIAFRLHGKKSNRDAIGAAATVEAEGHKQTKYLQAGSGFLSQHTKELFFGVGKAQGNVRASIRWPSGLTQVFEHLPVNRRIEIEEGSEDFAAKRFATAPASYARAGETQTSEALPESVETWLIEPLSAPEFSLSDLAGNLCNLQSFRRAFVLLNFWTAVSPACGDQLRAIQKYQSTFAASGLRVLGINVDDAGEIASARSFADKVGLSFPILLATQEVAGIYNIVYRYLFDRRRDLALPTSFLVNADGMIVKVYQGPVSPERIAADLKSVPRSAAARMKKALPFEGTLYQDEFQRNDFTYGVALFQRGYLEQAAASFQQVIAAKPREPEAYYNLGTLYLRKNALPDARRYLERTVKLRSDYPEAWNNLGMVAGQEGHADEAIRNFKQSLVLRPGYVTALLNLGNLYRRQGAVDEAEKLLNRALELEPDNPETNYSLGMLYARQDQLPRASNFLEKAVNLRPEYPDALNNLGVLFVRQQNYPEAKERFETCIRVAPNYDQAYLNLARLYVVLNDKPKAREVLLALLRRQPQHKLA
ncbi:MAG TPA: FG-GAP-like repeat-containing protein, partial [Candidatus Acidoferrum sp.]